MQNHNVDKALSLVLVLAGLAFLYLTKGAGNLGIVGIVVTIAGAFNLVNAQVMGALLTFLEKQLGVNAPLSSPSVTTSAAQSTEAQSSTLQNTSLTATPQAATAAATNTLGVSAPGMHA